jgi:hypothetical protein
MNFGIYVLKWGFYLNFFLCFGNYVLKLLNLERNFQNQPIYIYIGLYNPKYPESNVRSILGFLGKPGNKGV